MSPGTTSTRRDELHPANGSLLGSSMAKVALLAMVDLAHRGRIWHRVGSGHARTAPAAVALTSVALTSVALTSVATLATLEPSGLAIGWAGIGSIIIFVGFVSPIAWAPAARLEPGSWMALLAYVLLMFLIWNAGG